MKDVVKEKYGQAALRVQSGAGNSCYGGSAPVDECCDPIASNLYDSGQDSEVPATALRASLGCGNPTALAELKPGETVLDLGSGGGIDVLLSARRVGPTGRAYGLDMTNENAGLAYGLMKWLKVDHSRGRAGGADRGVKFLRTGRGNRDSAVRPGIGRGDGDRRRCVGGIAGDAVCLRRLQPHPAFGFQQSK